MTRGVDAFDLNFAYGKDSPNAVSELSFSVDPGEILALVGPSGSGKTTLLRLVTGLLTPSSGRIEVGGEDVTRLPPERRPVAMVFQGFALFPHMNIADNIGFGLWVRKVPKHARAERVADIARQLGIEGLLRRHPSEISGGERQRAALGRALIREPRVFCLDEPLSSLDAALRGQARRYLDGLLREDGRCALYVTHDQDEAMTLADRVAVVRDGRIEQTGKPRDLYDHPSTSFVASFIGGPPMNLVPAGTRGFPNPREMAKTQGVRAEHIQLVPGEDAVVVSVDDLGHEVIVELDINATVLLARLPRSESPPRGMRTGFEVDARHVASFDAEGRSLE